MRTVTSLVLASIALAPCALGADFNGDGFDDLAVGIRGKTVNGFPSAGRVMVMYGSASGLDGPLLQSWDETSFGAAAVPAASELFGFALAAGDFDGDGFDDLAISAWGERVKNLAGAGAVYVLYGSSGGLGAARLQIWHQDSKGVKDKVEADTNDPNQSWEGFGRDLAAGDFDADGRDDLAISVSESLGKKNSKRFAGAVHVLRGSKKGLTGKKSQFWHQDKKGMPGVAAESDLFGETLLAADLDHDGVEDLAIGALLDNGNQGSVTILRGKAGKGLVAKGARLLDEAALGGLLPAEGESYRYFGSALAAGDFRGDGRLELAIGTQGLPLQGKEDAGGVYVARFLPGTFELEATQHWTRLTPNVDGDPGELAYFGGALAAADFNADGRDDLAIGAGHDTVADVQYCGTVTVLRGSSTGLNADNDLLLYEGNAGMPETADYGDHFGGALAAADFNSDGRADLAVGVEGEHFPLSVAWSGALVMIPGSTNTLLDPPGAQWIDQALNSIPGDPESNDAFASALE